MQSLKTRLEPIRDEVLQYTKTYGRFKAMDKYQVKDYACYHRWLEEVTNDPEFGFDSTSKRFGHM